jgi:hypothetical protein
MKKIIISQEEKDRILESHNSYREDLMGHLFDKNLIKEQQSFTAPEANPQGYTEPSKVLRDAQTKCTQGSRELVMLLNTNMKVMTKKLVHLRVIQLTILVILLIKQLHLTIKLRQPENGCVKL